MVKRKDVKHLPWLNETLTNSRQMDMMTVISFNETYSCIGILKRHMSCESYCVLSLALIKAIQGHNHVYILSNVYFIGRDFAPFPLLGVGVGVFLY